METYKKKLKLKQITFFNTLFKQNNFIAFCRYNDLTSSDFLNLKLFYKQNKLQFKVIKQSLLHKVYNLKGQGPLLLIYCDDFKILQQFYKSFSSHKQLKILFFLTNNTKVSILKATSILNNPIPLAYKLKSTIFQLYATLKQIQQKANIT